MEPQTRPGLEHLRVVSSCPKQWEEMEGTVEKRFCGDCQKHVHNLSAMTRREVDELQKATACHLCVHYVPDAHGNPLTLSERPATYRIRWGLARALAIAAGVAVVICMPAKAEASGTWAMRFKALTNSSALAQKGRTVKAVEKACDKLQQSPEPTLRGEPVPLLGKPVMPPTSTGTPAPAPSHLLGRPGSPPKSGNSGKG